MLINLIDNIAFLIALAATGQLVVSRFHSADLKYRLVLGILFGSVSLLVMTNPVDFAPGVFFDGRSIVLAVAGVVGGGLTAAIAAGMAALYRYQLGGIGASAGVTVILLAALLGVLARQWWQRRRAPPHYAHYLALGVLVQLMQLAAFTQIPDQAGYPFIEQAWWILLLFYPFATMLLCQIFRNYEQQLEEREALQAAQQAVIAEERASMDRFHAYFDHSMVGLAITSLEKGWIEVNDALCQSLGYPRDELVGLTWTELTYHEDLAPDLAQFNRMLAGEINSYALDKRFIHKDGHLVYTRLAVSHVRKPDGSLDYVVAMVEDISDRKRSELDLESSTKQLRFVLEGSELGFWDWDIAAGKVERNERWAMILGYTQSEIQHTVMQWTDFIHPEDRARAWDSIKAVIDGGSSMHRLEYRMFHKDGRPVRMCGTHTDITARKQSELEQQQREQYQQALLDNFPFAVWLKDTESRFLAVNQGFAQLLSGRNVDNLIGKNDFDIWPADLAEGYRADDQDVLASGKKKNIEEEIVDGGGTRRWFETYKAPVFDAKGSALGTVGFARDITERKQAEAELEQYRLHLEEVVAKRTRELALAKEAAETANVAKSTFLANMSHEIRTPLNAITGMAHLLRRSGLTPQQTDKLDKIENAGTHLLSIINDVLDLSKIEAGKFALEDAPIRIEAILGNIASMLGQKASDKGLSVKLESVFLPHNLHGDPTRLQQALLNYASNAVKFTESGHIILRVKEEAQTEATTTLRFEVEDTGIGIAPDALSKIFSAFEQADNSTTRKYGGTGLGLAITKKIAEVMGGKVGASSKPGQGSTFWFTAVLGKGQQPAEAGTRAGNESAERIILREHVGKRVLLVEDEPINREIAQMLLEDVGLRIDLAEDGRQGVEKARMGNYDLILMDMQMPVLDGLDATREIRKLPGYQATPILAMTANAFSDNRDQCFDAGMDDFIAKPAKPETLYATLLHWFEKAPR